MLDPRLLRSFVVLAEELHFGRAAKRLHVAQPGLSQQIQRLEQQVGSRLYTRDSRGVELTDAGQAMLEPARTAIRAAEQAERAAREAARTGRHPLRVGVDFSLEDIVPAVVAYASENAEVQLWLARMHEAHGQEMLAAGLLDAFVGLSPTENTSPDRQRAIDVPLFALVGSRHPLATCSAVSPKEFRQSSIAILCRDLAPEQFDYFVNLFSEGEGRHALSIREFHPSGSDLIPELVEEVASGQAVSFGTPASFGSRTHQVRVLPFDPPMVVPTRVSWQTGRSAVTDRFAQHMGALS